MISKSIDGEEIWVALHVDNLLITGHDELIEPFVAAISKQYVIRDMGVPEVFLGCEVKRATDTKSITINCSKYIERMAKRFGLLNCKPVQTPMDHDMVLTIDDLSSKGDS